MQNIGPIFIKLATKHHYVKGIQICTNVSWSFSLLRRDTYNIAKTHFSRTIGTISTKHDTKHPCVKGTQTWLNKGPLNSHKGDNVFFSWYNHRQNKGPLNSRKGDNGFFSLLV